MQAYSGFARLNGAPGDDVEAFRFTGFLDLTTSIVTVEGVLAALLARSDWHRREARDFDAAGVARDAVHTHRRAAGWRRLPSADGKRIAQFRPRPRLSGPRRRSVRDRARRRAVAGFCAAVGLPDLADDPRFARNADRVRNRAALDAIALPIFAAPMIWWMRACERRRVPCAMAQNFEQLRYHAQVRDNAMIADVPTADWGTVVVGGLPWHFTKPPAPCCPPVPARTRHGFRFDRAHCVTRARRQVVSAALPRRASASSRPQAESPDRWRRAGWVSSARRWSRSSMKAATGCVGVLRSSPTASAASSSRSIAASAASALRRALRRMPPCCCGS